MQLITKLDKPYTDEQRATFIIDNNHKLGYEIRETETALEAWGYTEEEKEEQEQEMINNLTMTALDFVTFLESAGVVYADISSYLSANPDLDKQLKYCQNVYCGVVKQLLPITVAGITITSEMVEQAFKLKNGVQ